MRFDRLSGVKKYFEAKEDATNSRIRESRIPYFETKPRSRFRGRALALAIDISTPQHESIEKSTWSKLPGAIDHI
jgi:hypothetical protein